MFARILIPTDLSEDSRLLVSAAAAIHGVREILLLHIVRGDPEAAAAALDRQRQIITDPAVVVRCLIPAGSGEDIPSAILKAAETEHPSLILMGARRGILSRGVLGQGGTRILTRIRSHVLILRFPATGIFGRPAAPAIGDTLFERILFPLDFSRPANAALACIPQISRAREVILLHVIRNPGRKEGMNFLLRETEHRLADAREAIRQAGPGIRVRMMTRFGDPAGQIAAVASEENVSLIMMSRYGKMDYLRQVPLGTTSSKVATQASSPLLILYTPISLDVTVRELSPAEFYIAEKIWFDYRQTRSDPNRDRIFAVFVEDTPVSVARCKRHDDGFEVDGIFTWKEFRGKGYARMALSDLIRVCGSRTLYMYAVQGLESFYASLGFERIPERDLPPSVRKRYEWAMGDMKGAEVVPMQRPGSPV